MSWKEIGIKEKMQIVNGTGLVISAVALYFIAFFITLHVGLDVISAGATLLASGLAFFGLTTFVKSQLVNFEAKIDKKINEIENKDRNN